MLDNKLFGYKEIKYKEILSNNNKLISELVKLNNKKFRDDNNIFFIEGEKFIAEIPDDYKIKKLILSKGYLDYLLGLKKNTLAFKNKNIFANVFVLCDNLFNKISDTKKPQGILAICEKKSLEFNSLIKNISDKNFLLVILDNINDPGNLGSLIRSCAAFNVDGLIISKGSVDLYNPKVLRAAAGNIFKLNICLNNNLELCLPELKKNNINIFATGLKTKEFCFNIDFRSKCAIIIGNEANGVSKNILDYADKIIKIPMDNQVESLNASVAASILLYQAYVQKKYANI